jgi:hypothetical protein
MEMRDSKTMEDKLRGVEDKGLKSGTMLRRRDFLKLVAALAFAGTTSINLVKPAHAAENPPLVLCLGWDGMDYRSATQLLGAGQLPNLAQLNLYRLLAWPTKSVTKPGWTEIESGLGCGTTNIFTNPKFNSNLQAEWTIFGQLRRTYPNCWLSLVHSKYNHTGDRLLSNGHREPFYYLRKWALQGNIDRFISASLIKGSDYLYIEETRSYLIQHINDYNASGKIGGLIFVHFHDPDYTGHRSGMGSSEWNEKAIRLDQILGEAVALLSPGIIFVMSDHGFDDFGLKKHVNAPQGVIASNQPMLIDGIRCDAAVTLLKAMGVNTGECTPALYGKDLSIQS